VDVKRYVVALPLIIQELAVDIDQPALGHLQKVPSADQDWLNYGQIWVGLEEFLYHKRRKRLLDTVTVEFVQVLLQPRLQLLYGKTGTLPQFLISHALYKRNKDFGVFHLRGKSLSFWWMQERNHPRWLCLFVICLAFTFS